MKTRVEYLLNKLAEECNEAGQAIGKIQSFTMFDHCPMDDEKKPNLLNLHNELCDIQGTWNMLCAELGVDSGLSDARIENKPHKVRHWAERSVTLGVLEDTDFKYFQEDRDKMNLEDYAKELRITGLTVYVRKRLVDLDMSLRDLATKFDMAPSALTKAFNGRVSNELRDKLVWFFSATDMLPPNFHQAVQAHNEEIPLNGLQYEHKVAIAKLTSFLKNADSDSKKALLGELAEMMDNNNG